MGKLLRPDFTSDDDIATSCHLNAREMVAWAEAIRRGWLIVPAGWKRDNLPRAWRIRCRATRDRGKPLPWLRLRRAAKYSTISLDYLTVHGRPTLDSREAAREIGRQAMRQPGWKRGAFVAIGGDYWTISGVPNAEAEVMAALLYDVMTAPAAIRYYGWADEPGEAE